MEYGESAGLNDGKNTDFRISKEETVVPAHVAFEVSSLTAIVKPSYRLIYNPSESAPRGWYALVPARDISIDTLVFARLPSDAETIAAQRGHLPSSVQFLKHVVATHGHHVCSSAGMLTIDGMFVGRALTRDGAGRLLPRWTQCRSLEEGKLSLPGRNHD